MEDAFVSNGFIKYSDENKKITVELKDLDKNSKLSYIYTFPFETNNMFNIKDTDINIGIGKGKDSDTIILFINKDHAVDLNYDSPLRTFYDKLMPEIVKTTYRFDTNTLKIKVVPNIELIINIVDIDKDTLTRRKKIEGSLIGGAIGDALGYQIEFKRGITDKQVTDYLGDKGIISDDTQMTLFTANGLLFTYTRGSLRGISMLPKDAVYEAYLDWLDTQNNSDRHRSICWIKNIKELNIPRAPGNTCITALASGKMGTIEEPINDSKGCGGIMRVAPVGLYINGPIEAGRTGAEVAAITHGHPLGIIPSYVLSTMIWYLSHKELTIEEALSLSIKQYFVNFNNYDEKYRIEFINLVNKAIELAKSDMSDVEAIKELGEGWVAEETFAIAIYSCLKYQNSFRDAVICAINHDGDSDSAGAVAGNIMGAYLGIDNIPKEYIDKLELKDVILELADDMSVSIPVSEYSTVDDPIWLDKYLYCKRGN